jgi:hypothetical protein
MQDYRAASHVFRPTMVYKLAYRIAERFVEVATIIQRTIQFGRRKLIR